MANTWSLVADRALARAKTIPPLVALAVVTLVAMLNFLVNVDTPANTVWDESYYLTYTQRYKEGIAQFASHPPLGLMLLAAGDALSPLNDKVDTHPLGRDKKTGDEHLPLHYSFVGQRAASGVFAVGGAMVFFALMLTLTGSPLAAMGLSGLYVFENAFIVHFRAAHLDAFQIFFSVCALWCFVKCLRRAARSAPLLDFTLGAMCGFAAMVKLNAILLALLGVMVVARRLVLAWREQRPLPALARSLRDGAIMTVGGLAAIAAVFSIYVAVSRHPPDLNTPAGQKDYSYLSRTFRDYLKQRRPYSPAVVLAAEQDYRRFLNSDFDTMARTDENASDAWQWPFHRKTINYRWDAVDGITRYVQLCGNVFDWFLALLAPVATLALLGLQVFRPVKSSDPGRMALLTMLLIEYVVFMAVHAWLGTQRVTYLYHYFIGLLLAFTMLPPAWLAMLDRWPRLRRWQQPLAVTAFVLMVASFQFYAPLTFHRPLSHAQCEWRNVLQHEVKCQP